MIKCLRFPVSYLGLVLILECVLLYIFKVGKFKEIDWIKFEILYSEVKARYLLVRLKLFFIAVASTFGLNFL